MTQELFAFWRYDQYPFLLGDQIEAFYADGRVRVVGYGGYTFTPAFILPKPAGSDLLEKLENLKVNYQSEVSRLAREWKSKVENLIPKGVSI